MPDDIEAMVAERLSEQRYIGMGRPGVEPGRSSFLPLSNVKQQRQRDYLEDMARELRRVEDRRVGATLARLVLGLLRLYNPRGTFEGAATLQQLAVSASESNQERNGPMDKVEAMVDARLREGMSKAPRRVDEAFTRRHYVAVAGILRKVEDEDTKAMLVDEFTKLFEKDNPRFAGDRFKAACR